MLCGMQLPPKETQILTEIDKFLAGIKSRGGVTVEEGAFIAALKLRIKTADALSTRSVKNGVIQKPG